MLSLVFTDAHVHHGDCFDRFTALGKLIADRQPTNIFQLGDFCSIESLSRWNNDKRQKMEGQRYKLDTQAAKKAITHMLAPIVELQTRQRFPWKTKVYKPNWHWFFGNHEQWVWQYVERNPEMEGHIDLPKDIGVDNLGWNLYFNKDTAIIDNITFCHAPVAKGGKLVSGKYGIFRASDLCTGSVVFGHTHRLEQIHTARHGSSELNKIISCGCFFPGVQDYAEGEPDDLWRGVLLLQHHKNGFDIETISLERLMSTYV